MKSLLLDSKTLKYKPYRDSRYDTVEDFEGGFSGELLLATALNGKKYLIKHSDMAFASNEYVASKLATKMGLSVAKTYLLTPDKRLGSQYAVAIEFIEGLETFRSFKELSEWEKEEAIAQISFSIMIDNVDFAQLRRSNGKIMQIDFAETFAMNSMFLKMAYEVKQAPMIAEFLNGCRKGFAEHVRMLDFDLSFMANDFDMDPGRINEIGISFARRLLDVTEDDIAEIENELQELYPPEYVANYVEDIHALQTRIRIL